MERSQRRGWVVAHFGNEPASSAKYRLPLGVSALIFFITLFLFIPDKGLDDLTPLAVGIFITLYALGDRTWVRNVKAAAWLRMMGSATMFAGVGALATHFTSSSSGAG